jgi:hypothetical protein
MNVYIFTGPTLSAQDVCAELDAVCLPPVSQGDVYRACLARPWAIGIIDGYFESVPAVWHKEILWAMTQGIHVFGSASMGALRAAELASFGMVGVGKIFEAFLDGTLEDDDEVAVLHGPADAAFLGLSEAMVNIRATMARAEVANVLSSATRTALERIGKDFYYGERSYANILKRGAAQRLPGRELEALGRWLPSGRVNQKREDALAMLRAMWELLATSPQPKRVSFSFEETEFWDRARRQAGEISPEVESGADALVLDQLRRSPGAYDRAYHQAMLRYLALEESRRRQAGTVPAEALLQVSEEFCQRRGIHHPDEAHRWLADHDISHEQFVRLMQEEVQLRWVELAAKRDIEARLIDCLRLSGEYRRLLDQARQQPPQGAMRPVGLEPTTSALKVPCSTD